MARIVSGKLRANSAPAISSGRTARHRGPRAAGEPGSKISAKSHPATRDNRDADRSSNLY